VSKIVVDSNIVFSAILNSQNKIGQLILDGSRYFDFYSISLLKREILAHQNKILAISGYSDGLFFEIYDSITSKIKFIDDIILSNEELLTASDLVKTVDENDMLFVALTNHLKASLWTGDKKLIAGLKLKGYNKTISTEDLYQKYLKKQLQRSTS